MDIGNIMSVYPSIRGGEMELDGLENLENEREAMERAISIVIDHPEEIKVNDRILYAMMEVYHQTLIEIVDRRFLEKMSLL